MTDQNLTTKRNAERSTHGEYVSVTFSQEPIAGSGQNISASGVYFVAEADVEVTVQIDGREVRGHLVRVENHGAGKIGIAVKFDREPGD